MKWRQRVGCKHESASSESTKLSQAVPPPSPRIPSSGAPRRQVAVVVSVRGLSMTAAILARVICGSALRSAQRFPAQQLPQALLSGAQTNGSGTTPLPTPTARRYLCSSLPRGSNVDSAVALGISDDAPSIATSQPPDSNSFSSGHTQEECIQDCLAAHRKRRYSHRRFLSYRKWLKQPYSLTSSIDSLLDPMAATAFSSSSTRSSLPSKQPILSHPCFRTNRSRSNKAASTKLRAR